MPPKKSWAEHRALLAAYGGTASAAARALQALSNNREPPSPRVSFATHSPAGLNYVPNGAWSLPEPEPEPELEPDQEHCMTFKDLLLSESDVSFGGEWGASADGWGDLDMGTDDNNDDYAGPVPSARKVEPPTRSSHTVPQSRPRTSGSLLAPIGGRMNRRIHRPTSCSFDHSRPGQRRTIFQAKHSVSSTESETFRERSMEEAQLHGGVRLQTHPAQAAIAFIGRRPQTSEGVKRRQVHATMAQSGRWLGADTADAGLSMHRGERDSAGGGAHRDGGPVATALSGALAARAGRLPPAARSHSAPPGAVAGVCPHYLKSNLPEGTAPALSWQWMHRLCSRRSQGVGCI